MRHKYETRGIVLARTAAGEAGASLAILTDELGLVWARAAGVRRSGGKLASSLATFVESDLVLVRGREGWRVTGAVLRENWFRRLGGAEARTRAARVAGLLLRLAPGEVLERAPYAIMTGFFAALAGATEAAREGAELVAAARLLSALGLDDTSTELVADDVSFAPATLMHAFGARENYVARINRGIAASGL